MTAMQSRLQLFQRTLQHLGNELKAFQESQAKFRILTTVDNTNLEPHDPSNGSEEVKTLFILDSSFNPPSIAHQSLAESALQKSASDEYPKPHRLLLLFSTMNADKAPSAASFDQRVTMMSMFAGDILSKMTARPDDFSAVPIDVGVSKAPYYSDKSEAVEAEGSTWYRGNPKHVHLTGYDTLTRIFAAKYYKDFSPPFSALDPYFEAGHELRVTLRPGDEYGSMDDQHSFLQRLRSDELIAQGARAEWAHQVRLIPPNPKAGVSSTKIRQAAKAGAWETVKELCTPTVAAWIEQEQLYAEDAKGKKTA